MKKMNILVTCDGGYAKQAALMLFSLQKNHSNTYLDIYVAGALQEGDIALMGKALDQEKSRITHIAFDGEILQGAPTTDRYPVEMYYRIFAARYLPQELDRVLYLDPDLTVIGSLEELYHMEMGNAFFAAASHVKEETLLEKVNQLRLDMEGVYINSGVMLLNLEALRREQEVQAVIDYINTYEKLLILPDQDVISGLYSDRILPIDAHVYNMTERILMLEGWKGLDADWVCRHSAIIHYCGKNKPWKPMYKGKLDIFYLLNRKEWEKKIEE